MTSERERWGAVVVASAAVAATMFDTFGISQSLPTIGTDLDASDTELQWIINAASLASAIALIPAGRVADRWGRRLVACGGLALFAIGSGLGAIAPSIGQLIVARLVVGVATAAIVAASLAIVTGAVSERNRSLAVSVWTAITAAGAAIGPLAAGVITEQLSWRWYLAGVGVVAAVMVVTMWVTAEESSDPAATDSLDLAGVATLGIGLGGVVYGLMTLPEANVDDVRAIAAILIGVVALAAFVAVERRASAPLLDLGLFLRPRYLAIAAVVVAANWAYAAMLFFVPQYLQNVLDLSAGEAGAVFLLFTVPYGVLSLLVGKVQTVVRAFVLTMAGLCALVVAFTLAGLISVGHGLGVTVAGLLIAAVGQSLVFNASGTQALDAGGTAAGTASGTLSTIRQLGFLLGIAVTGTIVQVTQTFQLGRVLSANGFDVSWADRREATAGVSGASFEPDALPVEAAASIEGTDVADALFVDGLRVGYWVVAALCGVAVLAAWASRQRTFSAPPLTSRVETEGRA